MSGETSTQGLSCPRCGGIVHVPEGQILVICPYCEQRSVVSAAEGKQDELGVRRYQVPVRAGRETLEKTFRGFVSGKYQVARDCASQARISEIFLVHLPFWTVWGRGVAWAFGQQEVGSGDSKHYEPREKRAVSELSWNSPACEVGEFGVQRVSLDGRPLEPFDAASLHRTGMVFEPVGSAIDSLEAARSQFSRTVKKEISLDRTEQQFVRLINTRQGLVYYPLWVIRYLYRGRSFQVVIDGFDGQVIYGKAPGSVAYRAGVLIGGMAVGSVLAIDIPALILMNTSSSKDSPWIIALIAFVGGFGMMFSAYHTFRRGEHYEYHRYPALASGGDLSLSLKTVGNVVNALEKFT